MGAEDETEAMLLQIIFSLTFNSKLHVTSIGSTLSEHFLDGILKWKSNFKRSKEKMSKVF